MPTNRSVWGLIGLGVAACSSNDPHTAVSRPQGDVPCEIATVIEQRCIECHGTVLHQGAPMRLLTAADFAMDVGGQTVAQVALFRIMDVVRPMPPPPKLPLTPGELLLLQGWLGKGAQGEPTGCAVVEPMAASGAGGASSTGGTSATGGVVVASGGATGGVSPIGGTAGTGNVAGLGNGGQFAAGGAGGSAGAGGVAGEGGVAGASGSGGAGPVVAGWSMFGGDLANSRSNPKSTISPSSFGSFHRVWQFAGPAVTSTPAVVDGVVYFSGWDAKVYAVHAADGSPIWTAAVPHLVDSSPAVTADRVFVGDNNGFVHALDRNSGAVAWSRAVETVGLPHLWSSPVAIPDAGLVVVGVASAEESNAAGKPFTFRGSIAALDTATGDKRWQAYTTSNDFTSGPGIGIWSTAAVDPELKLLYIGTGNAYTAPAGQYTDSLLAIRYDTGRRLRGLYVRARRRCGCGSGSESVLGGRERHGGRRRQERQLLRPRPEDGRPGMAALRFDGEPARRRDGRHGVRQRSRLRRR
jgi:outer membrane protein assembly factor BamB